MKQFNTWERYFDPKHPKHKYQVDRHNWFIERICGENILDVGCSGGLLLYLAGKRGDIKRLYGIDICERTNELARERLKKYINKEILILNTGAESLPFIDNYFDTVICGETLEHVNNDIKSMSEITRVTKIGGTILISVPKNGHLSKEHIRLYSKKTLNDLIESSNINIVEEGEMKASKNGYYLLVRGVKCVGQ